MTMPNDRGICGDLIWTAGVTPTRCALLAEHPGWHRADNGMSWSVHASDGARAAYARGVAEGRRQATQAVRAQASLPDLVHFGRPSDFRKGVLTCLAALEAAEQDGADRG